MQATGDMNVLRNARAYPGMLAGVVLATSAMSVFPSDRSMQRNDADS